MGIPIMVSSGKIIEEESDLPVLDGLVGKTVKAIKYDPGYCNLTVEFTDGSDLDIDVEDECGHFIVTVGGQPCVEL